MTSKGCLVIQKIYSLLRKIPTHDSSPALVLAADNGSRFSILSFFASSGIAFPVSATASE
jgi:hypothetical protein